jgi:hypothetical protein
MQPYLFPYIGYFQLINKVDRFIFLDDVNFINKGWINRNRLLFDKKVNYFSVPLSKASQNNHICKMEISADTLWRSKLEKSIHQSYSKAQYFNQVFDLISPVIFNDNIMIGEMAKESIIKIINYLSITTDLIPTSAIYKNQQLKGEARIIDICKKEGSSNYINLPGGQNLYNVHNFALSGIKITFIDVLLPVYPQFSSKFEPGLSIIDVLMHNSPSQVLEMLA